MHVSKTTLDVECNLRAAGLSDADIESLLQPFHQQSTSIESIVIERQGCEVYRPETSNDLLLLPANVLNEMMTPLADNFPFRAVAALFPEAGGQPGDETDWKLRRSLFDRGLVCIGSVHLGARKALCFLASDDVRSLSHLNVESRGHITMSTLGQNGRFANQLFQYACVKLYALRHGLTTALPGWDGNQLYGLEDKSCAGLALPRRTFLGFADDDRQFWDMEDPPINIDLEGYFQEIPECWRRHRPLLRRLFQLPAEQSDAIDAWRDAVTEGGRRTLVVIHVRRGDYRSHQNKNMPWLRFVPTAWYVDWLRAIWPTLREPLLFVGTDEPDRILPVFREFESISATFGSVIPALPDHIRDFEVMRRADYLALANSSFSRMAAILAAAPQKCFLPSFQTQSFEPYEPWIDPAFWARFADSWRVRHLRGRYIGQSAPMSDKKTALDAPEEQATIFFDVSDLVSYLLDHATLSGIQRVQCEILSYLLDIPNPEPVRFVVLNQRGGLGAIETSALQEIIEDIRSGTTYRPDVKSAIRALLNRAIPCMAKSRDIFLTIGAFWGMRGMGLLLQQLKNSGVIIGVLIHDIIPLTSPEYFDARATRVHVKGVIEALTFADFIFTTTEYNKASIAEHIASRKLDPLPVHLAPLGHELLLPEALEPEISSIVSSILSKNYVLCVGTIEVRKNPTYLFNIWKMMVKSGRPKIPYLVFVGRKGWLVQDFMDQLQACNYLGGRILVVHNVTDVELDLLYRQCILTVFPSFVEGWGLPVGESLSRQKICISSGMGGIPEVGGELVDYIDPYNACEGLERMLGYLDDPELRHRREREIAERFEPRNWGKVAEDLVRSTRVLARQVRPYEGIAAITLPADRFLPISSDVVSNLMDGMDGKLSAELICISGWHSPEISGVRAAQPATMIRFRANAQVGSRINLVLRLAASGRDFRIRICSGSGHETETFLPGGSEKLAVLSCEVEPGNLVTAHLTLLGAMLDGDEFPGASYWILKGILYIDLKNIAGRASKLLKSSPVSQALDAQRAATAPQRVEQLDRAGHILLRSVFMDDSRRAASLGEFLEAADSYWPSDFTSDHGAPIFVDRGDRGAFYSFCVDTHYAQVGRVNDSIKLIRRSDQFVSMSRFSEGSVFDRSGVWRALGYLQRSPADMLPWVSNHSDGLRVSEESLAKASRYDHSYLIFYNGNLHNYYHWLVEGLLCLDVLSGALGLDSNLKIALPKSMDIHAVLDHRESIRAVGLGQYEVIEVGANLMKVREAIWVDSDIVQTMPAPYLKDFQKRIACLYAGVRRPRNRRLLVARKGPVRKIHNIEQVEALLSRYDFETVYLEGMSMVDQILLFQSAEFIIGPHGAGLANLLFCEPGTKVIELMPSVEMRPFFWMISEKLDLVYGMQFCVPAGAQDFQSAITVDIAKLQALIHMVDKQFVS